MGLASREAARRIARFIQFYNHERYHSGIKYLTPADRYYGWDELARERQRQAAYERRRQYYEQQKLAERAVEQVA